MGAVFKSILVFSLGQAEQYFFLKGLDNKKEHVKNGNNMNQKVNNDNEKEENIEVQEDDVLHNPWINAKSKTRFTQKSRNNFDKKEEEYNCNDCDYQGYDTEQLRKHTTLKHELRGRCIECKYCGKLFQEKVEFMEHRKTEHPGTVALCRKNVEGICPYSTKACWWSHCQQNSNSIDNIECYICSKTFTMRSDMMRHRKLNHSKVVRQCEMFKRNNCRFKSDSCWFLHEMVVPTKDTNEGEEVIMEEEINSQSVFQKTSWNMKPPNPPTNQKKQKME